MRCPSSDEEFHAVLRWFWADPDNRERVIAGAWLAFCGLTGLRPGEPAHLHAHMVADIGPISTALLTPGMCRLFPDGQLRMFVRRSKHGQNPWILLHPACIAFLSRYHAWRMAQLDYLRNTRALFPLSSQHTYTLPHFLAKACRSLGLPRFTPHGFGRAFYVRVRRSQGHNDATIAAELGQTSNGTLIRQVYGDPSDSVGGLLYDWLPDDGQPAWDLLSVPTNGSAGASSGETAPIPSS